MDKVKIGNKQIYQVLDFSNDEDNIDIINNIEHLSISGVQEKLSVVINKGRLVIADRDTQSTHILKTIPSVRTLRYREYIPANENLTMDIAKYVYKIKTADNAIVFFKNSEMAYLTKRFDIDANGNKIMQEDFSSLMQINNPSHNSKYYGSYEDIALLISKYTKATKIELGKFFKLVLFNYLFGNGDAHLKNFSLQITPNLDYVLTPAYDLMNTSLHINDSDFALSDGLSRGLIRSEIYTNTSHPCIEDFIEFGKIIGLLDIQINTLIKPFIQKQDKVYDLCNSSYLDNSLKRMYIRSYEERFSRLIRK